MERNEHRRSQVGRLGGGHPDCEWLNGDLNGDGNVTFDDLDPFVAAIGSAGLRVGREKVSG